MQEIVGKFSANESTGAHCLYSSVCTCKTSKGHTHIAQSCLSFSLLCVIVLDLATAGIKIDLYRPSWLNLI